jgi:hypothetical protein
MKFSVVLAAVIVVAVSLIWGVGVGLLALGGALLGLLVGALRRALSEPVEDRLERHRRKQDSRL